MSFSWLYYLRLYASWIKLFFAGLEKPNSLWTLSVESTRVKENSNREKENILYLPSSKKQILPKPEWTQNLSVPPATRWKCHPGDCHYSLQRSLEPSWAVPGAETETINVCCMNSQVGSHFPHNETLILYINIPNRAASGFPTTATLPINHSGLRAVHPTFLAPHADWGLQYETKEHAHQDQCPDAEEPSSVSMSLFYFQSCLRNLLLCHWTDWVTWAAKKYF
jgi:hypothetical protein